MRGDEELSPRFTKQSRLLSLHQSRFKFSIFSKASCIICGNSDHLDDDCPRRHWTIQQHLDFHTASSSYTGPFEEIDFLENADVSNAILDDTCSIPQSYDSCSVNFDCAYCYGEHKVDDYSIVKWSYVNIVQSVKYQFASECMVRSAMTCDSTIYHVSHMSQELKFIEIWVRVKLGKNTIVLELKVDLASSMALQVETDLLLSEQHT